MSKFIFGTKGQTLKKLAENSADFNVPELYIITSKKWSLNRKTVVREIQAKFKGAPLAIRSSSLIEDGNQASMAGAFQSFLNIGSNDFANLEKMIDAVFTSYQHVSEYDEVLLQSMVSNVEASGVIMTRNIADGSPYYVISYDDVSGKTDTITSGYGEHKTIYVLREFNPYFCDSDRVKKMLDLAKSLEDYTGNAALDIEFALDKSGMMHLLQVRRITSCDHWDENLDEIIYSSIHQTANFLEATSYNPNNLMGDFTLFGTMPDWNPAELLGPAPEHLSISLFRDLITNKIWALAREKMGYAKVDQNDLMVLLSGRPFIDIRASFNSLVPSGLRHDIGNKIVNAWLSLLDEQPKLHDKVEFEVIQSALTFDFDQVFESRFKGVLSKLELDEFRDSLTVLTNNLVDISEKSSLKNAISEVLELKDIQVDDYLFSTQTDDIALGTKIQKLLFDCRSKGTLQFSIIARHAFIAEDLLRSLIRVSAITDERMSEFRQTIHSIAQDITTDAEQLTKNLISKKDFMDKYGHLRPGSFDITSLTYRDRPDLFDNISGREIAKRKSTFELLEVEEKKINEMLKNIGIRKVDANSLFEYAKISIEWREQAKFIFTKSLSAILENIRIWGKLNGLSDNDLAFLNIEVFTRSGFDSHFKDAVSKFKKNLNSKRKEHRDLTSLKVNFLCKSQKDLEFVPLQRSEANYITKQVVKAPIVQLSTQNKSEESIDGKIVCIESADPGFDWIFSHGITGLITRFGGANSHMAIRCSELNIPAAIGCGEELYQRMQTSKVIEINCSKKIILIIA